MLSSLLLGAAKKSESGLDRNLESIFKTSVRSVATESSKNLMVSSQAKAAPTSPRPALDAVKAQSHASDPVIKKRKRHDKEDLAPSDETEKRAKKKGKQEQPQVYVSAATSTSSTRSKKMQASSEPSLSNPTKNLPTSKASPAKGSRDDIEEKIASPPICLDEQGEGQWDGDASEGSDEEQPLLHETITGSGITSSVPKPRRSIYVPEGETKELRDARTVFIGNVPMEVAKSKVNYNIHCMDLRLT